MKLFPLFWSTVTYHYTHTHTHTRSSKKWNKDKKQRKQINEPGSLLGRIAEAVVSRSGHWHWSSDSVADFGCFLRCLYHSRWGQTAPAYSAGPKLPWVLNHTPWRNRCIWKMVGRKWDRKGEREIGTETQSNESIAINISRITVGRTHFLKFIQYVLGAAAIDATVQAVVQLGVDRAAHSFHYFASN